MTIIKNNILKLGYFSNMTKKIHKNIYGASILDIVHMLIIFLTNKPLFVLLLLWLLLNC